MSERFYRVTLLDHAAASTIKMPRSYYGTEDDILAVVHDENFYSHELRVCAKDFFAGKNDGRIKGIPWLIGSFLSPVKVLGERVMDASCIQIKHTSIWGYDSYEYAAHARVRHVYVRDDRILRRCTQITMEDLWYNEPDDPRTSRPVKHDSLFGHPGIMVLREPDIIENRLLYSDTSFCCWAEMEADLQFPGGTDYNLFFDEITGGY